MRIISFDCATKSLAVSVIDFNEKWKETNPKTLNDYLNLINNLINIIYIDVFDLAPNGIKSITSIEKSINLKNCLQKLDIEFPNPDLILLEYQMASNHKSHDISSKIEYHYAPSNQQSIQPTKPKILIIGPSLKNTVALSPEGKYQNFIQKYTKYIANKNHSKFNFILFLKEFNKIHLISKIAKKNLDDAADSFMMAFAYIKHNFLKINKRPHKKS